MEESPVRILNNHEPTEARGLNRRQVMQRLLGTAGTVLVLGHTMEAADSQAAAPDWQPVFFDSHQNETLIALAERILPNSTRALVNRFIDTLISVDTQENQKKFLASLGAFDHEGIRRYNQPFKDLTEDQQNAILTAASTAQPSAPGQSGRRRRRPTVSAPGSEAPTLTMRDHFENIKGWVSGAFYSSELGMKELGWTGQVAWASLPGCPNPDGHT
jgi:Gluconate 2-dehydrogenase subunit 3